METFILCFAAFVIVVAGMAIGVILSDRRLKGSCGGLNLVPGMDACPVCGKDAETVRKEDSCGRDAA